MGKGERKKEYFTDSGIRIKNFYTNEDIAGIPLSEIGAPGEMPYTRGAHKRMYRERLWTFRQYSGFGMGEDTNKRYKFLIKHGQKGLNVALDLPTQMGLDSDDPLSFGEVGRVGVAIDTLKDMEDIFDGIPLNDVTAAFTVNATAIIILAMYMALAEKRGIPFDSLRGNLQNDILKEYVARGAYIFPAESSIKLIGDTIEYCIQKAPNYKPVSISPHMQVAGLTLAETTAYMFLIAIEYIKEVLNRGYNIDDFAANFSFLFAAGVDFFETIARLRAARKIWAQLLKERFDAKKEKTLICRIATSAECKNLVPMQPLNNIARITLLGLSSVLGGTQSMLLPSYDESFAIPTEESAKLSLRIQQILAHEFNITSVADPLGGSYYIEALTKQMEDKIVRIMSRVEEQGGIIRAIENGEVQRQMSSQAYEDEKKRESGEIVVVGLNKFVEEDPIKDIHAFACDPAIEERQISNLRKVKQGRDNKRVRESLENTKRAIERGDNLVEYLIEAVKEYVSVGEIVSVMKKYYGEFKEPRLF